jgi:hypothetical protein
MFTKKFLWLQIWVEKQKVSISFIPPAPLLLSMLLNYHVCGFAPTTSKVIPIAATFWLSTP